MPKDLASQESGVKPEAADAMPVLLDVNVVLDLLLNRTPFVADAVALFALAEAGEVELWVSCDSISTISYLVGKGSNRKTAKDTVISLMGFVNIAPLDGGSVLYALSLDFDDTEDALIAAAAENVKARAIITRNVKDFGKSPIIAMTPAEFLSAHAIATK